MSGFRIEGQAGVDAEVTSDASTTEHPRAVHVSLPLSADLAGFVGLASEVDAGDVTGARLTRAVEVSDDYRVRVGSDTPFLDEQFSGAALNSAIWTAPVTTMTVTVAGGFVNLNAGLSVASAAVARVQTYRTFPMMATSEVYAEIHAQFVEPPTANNVCEWGLGFAATTAAPTDGAFFRLNAAGEFRGVVNNNGTEIQTGTIDFNTLVGQTMTRHFVVAISDEEVRFWIDDVLVGSVPRGAAGSTMTASGSLPVLLRNYNSSAASAAQVMKVSAVSVWMGDPCVGKRWAYICAGAGKFAYQGQTGGTMGSTATYVNSADPAASAALTNTTAAVGSGLGGQFRFNAGVTAVTDGIVSSFQVPAATAALPGKTLYITGVKISAVNTGVAVATTASVIAWSLAFGHTAVSLATAEAATTKAPRRVALGFMSWPIAAPVGAMPDKGDLYFAFESPVVVQPGEFVQTVAKFVIGTATASQVILCHVTFSAFYE